MRRVVVVGFATKLHGEGYYESVYGVFRRYIAAAGRNVEFLPPVVSAEGARAAGESSRGSFPVLVSLTGGSSQLIAEFARSGKHRAVLLIGHGEHNSLPSAISARARLEADGVRAWVYHCASVGDPDCAAVVGEAIRVAGAVSRLLSSRVLLVSDAGRSATAESFEAVFEASVDVLPVDSIASRLSEADRGLVERFHKAIERFEMVASKERVPDVARLYAVLRSLVDEGRYSGVAVDCFPYLVRYRVTPCLPLAVLNAEGVTAACEGDLASLALMILSRELTGSTGWIANSSAFRGRRAYLAHCTIAADMVRSGKVVTHFESGYPYALSGEIRRGTYTTASLSRDYSKLAVGVGRLVAGGQLYETMCRTQAVVELETDAEEIPLQAPANHHVLIPGDVRRELRAASKLLGMNYIEYR